MDSNQSGVHAVPCQDLQVLPNNEGDVGVQQGKHLGIYKLMVVLQGTCTIR